MGASTYEYTSNENIRLRIFLVGSIDFFNLLAVNYCQVNNRTLFSTWSS
jgi:hypothetical protein